MLTLRLRQADFIDRNNFADFLNRRGLLGNAVEVGTHRGAFAKLFLDNWKGSHLYCVDPWSTLDGYEEQTLLLEDSNGNRLEDFHEAKRVLHKYRFGENKRCHLLTLSSEKGVEHFLDNSLDFVYIDADHRYEMVVKDLEMWYTKIRSGGILAGHDFICHAESDIQLNGGVQKAVLEFCEEQNLILHLVTERYCCPWSYYVEKS